jgi:hypothetical protein
MAEGKELQISEWHLEHAICVDDVITELTNRTPSAKEARLLTIPEKSSPEGDSLEEDIGYIQCEPPRQELVDLLQRMKRVPEIFQGHVYRDLALATTVIVQFGTTLIEGMLKRRKERINKDFKNWWDKKTTYTIQPYSWQALRPVEKGRIYYKYNFHVLDRSIRARLNNIKGEYELPLSFLVQMAVVEAARTSRLIPDWLMELLDQEHDGFEKWLNVKTTIDTM